MADNKEIAFDLEVKGVEQSISSVKELKNAIKAAKDEQLKAAQVYGESSEQFINASKNVSKLKDKVDDLNDSTQSLKGSGVERASQGFNQLGEGLRNLDFDKVKVGLVAMKSALAAVGIGLIVQGVMYLVENFNELSQGSSILAKALRGVGEILNGIKEALYQVSDAIGATNHQLDLMGDLITENVAKFKESVDAQTKGYDRQIAVMKAAGQETIDIEKKKQEQILFTNSIIVKQIEAYVRAGGELNDEKKKQLTAALESNKDAIAQVKILEINHTNDLEKENSKRLADHKKLLTDKQKANDDYAALQAQRNADALAILEAQNQKDLAKAEADKQQEIIDYENRKLLDIEIQDVKDKARQDQATKDAAAHQLNLQQQNEGLQRAQDITNSLQSLSDLYFVFKNKNLQKGTAAELKAAEQQFKINKALAITSAVISGIQGVINALSAQSVIPEPFGTILKVASAVGVGIAAAANVAKIASTKFSVSGGGGGASASLPSSPPIPSPPSISTQQNNTNQSTSFDETGKKIGGDTQNTAPVIQVKATVGVDEVASKTNRVETLEKQSTF